MGPIDEFADLPGLIDDEGIITHADPAPSTASPKSAAITQFTNKAQSSTDYINIIKKEGAGYGGG